MLKNIAILGSTGSIGTQALEVVRQHPGHFRAVVLTARNNADLLIRQAEEFRPDCVVIGCKRSYDKVKNALSGKGIKVYAGKQDLNEIAAHNRNNMVGAALPPGLLQVIEVAVVKRIVFNYYTQHFHLTSSPCPVNILLLHQVL